jgi:hypothetical protein
MPRYSPLPSVSIDPRSEADLVQAAAQTVYEASNKTLNDFSAGNPLAVLLEGQAFAQGEFLYWANQLPDKILIEWIGPFLGAMRRLGTTSTAELVVTIPPTGSSTVIPSGTIFSTNPQLTSGESYEFISNLDLVIPSGEATGRVPVYSRFVGSIYNVPSNSITGVANTGALNLSATNPQPSVGGSDVETFQEVQERFFTLIRRRNPVSESDWQDFFIDLYGIGTLTSVQPNRSNFYGYNYTQDYTLPNGQVSFFVLGPNGQELTTQQLSLGQNAVNFSVPVENQGHLFPITLSQVQYNLTVEVNSNGSFGSNFKDSSLNFRDKLFSVLTPGQTFPADITPTVSDIDAAFYSTFDANTRFRDPSITESLAYNTPNSLSKEAAVYTNVYDFTPSSSILKQNDLIVVNTPNPTFYPVEADFTPYSSNKYDQTVYGNLSLKQIKPLTSGSYLLGDIVYYDGAGDPAEQGLHVVLENLNIASSSDVLSSIASGKVSGVKTFSPWVVGNSYVYSSGGTIDPEIVEYNYSSGEFVPLTPSSVPLNSRPGGFAWLVSQNFTLNPSTNDITGAQTEVLIGSYITPQQLEPNSSYTSGIWVCTPQIGGGPSQVVDPYYNYVDLTKGAIVKYAYVEANFTYTPNELTVSEYFNLLVDQGVLSEILVFEGDGGLPIYKYKARFKAGQYLLYKESASSLPTYYISSLFFTPDSTNIQDLLGNGSVYNLAPTPALQAQLNSDLAGSSLKNFDRMFTFFLGDRTFFREGSNVQSYTATSAVTPLFDFNIYLNNGIFVESESLGQALPLANGYIPFFNPVYLNTTEDTILSEDGRNYYRVMKAFTPSTTVTNWTGMVTNNTSRYEEFAGNLLRFVVSYRCEEPVLSQYGLETSSIKLGSCQITIIPRNTGRNFSSSPNLVYVWENASTLSEVPDLSWYTGTTFEYSPPNYGEGTLAL